MLVVRRRFGFSRSITFGLYMGLLLVLPLKAEPQSPALQSDWCAGHDVPESKCTICNPELIPQFKANGDWCAGHNLPESVCPACNPTSDQASQDLNSHDWCAGHEVPESKCTLCNPELIPQFKANGDWCAEHSLPESVCPVCRPESPQTLEPIVADWCAGHDVPESKCTLCNPELIPHFKNSGDWCAEHELPESVCPSCNPNRLTPDLIEARIIRFRTAELEEIAGLVTAIAIEGDAMETVEVSANLEFHPDKVADIRTLIPGIMRKIHIQLGDSVEKGDTLYELESTHIADLQVHLKEARLKQQIARTNNQRIETLAKKGMVSTRDIELVSQELSAAQARYDSVSAELEMVGAVHDGRLGRFVIQAPLSGSLVQQSAVLGSHATQETSLGMIANTDTLWAICHVPEQLAHTIEVGMPVELLLNNGQNHRGKISWISTIVTPKTRTIQIRVEVKNPHGVLRANQFAKARIETGYEPHTLIVPKESVQRVGDHYVLFVRRQAGIYEPRVVETVRQDRHFAVKGRLSPGETVVTTGSHLLRTEILPGSIGAGCCEVEPLGN